MEFQSFAFHLHHILFWKYFGYMQNTILDTCSVSRPQSKLKFGGRGFSAAAPDAWKKLPVEVRLAPSLSVFTRLLKSELFHTPYQ